MPSMQERLGVNLLGWQHEDDQHENSKGNEAVHTFTSTLHFFDVSLSFLLLGYGPSLVTLVASFG